MSAQTAAAIAAAALQFGQEDDITVLTVTRTVVRERVADAGEIAVVG
jgi:hypothetical protein